MLWDIISRLFSNKAEQKVSTKVKKLISIDIEEENAFQQRHITSC